MSLLCRSKLCLQADLKISLSRVLVRSINLLNKIRHNFVTVVIVLVQVIGA